jgi:Nucleotidyl transferase AbiEii toxin, Type IV TA system
VAGRDLAGKLAAPSHSTEFACVGILTPNLSILPSSQRRIWNQLGATPNDFVLYGGTALALRLGHRQSVDFDFFSRQSFRPLDLARSISYLTDQTVTQQSVSTLSCEIGTGREAVKISFFGGLSLGQIETPDIVESNGIAVASLRDLFGMKCATVPQRNEIKDYLDIYALITVGRIDLADGVACARAIYGRQYNPVLTLQALSFFDDLHDPLSEDIKIALHAAVRSVSLQDLPAITAPEKIGANLVRP